MCSSPKGKGTSTSRNLYPSGVTQLSTQQYGSFAQVANAASERREAKKAILESSKSAVTDKKETTQKSLPSHLPLYQTIKEKLQMLLTWLHLSAK